MLIGPPGAGKTTRLVRRVRQATAEGQRAWWIGLPSQRAYVYRRLTEAGALLGAEFLSSQQLYYRLLAHGLKLKPLVVGTGRLALVGEALKELRGELPAPGEARLFATAIAEAKRFGLAPEGVAVRDEESLRFQDVFRRYEQVKGDSWDYDDFRSEAYSYLQDAPTLEAQLIVIDGFREVGPLELKIYKALSKCAEVHLALPECPPGETPTERLPEQEPSSRRVYRAANPVSEARWVLRSLKRDLAEGLDPLDVAVILPEREIRAFTALADEYGVPLMDETPRALTDSLAGRLLLDLLELPDYPTASKLLAVPELNPLAQAVLDRRLAGPEATQALARDLGLETVWRRWLNLLSVPEDELTWAEQLLNTALPELRADLSEDGVTWTAFKKHALQRAKEASKLALGASFRAWWAALLQETKLFERPKGGVALLTDKLASGRRFKRVYLMHAVEGAYTTGEREDFFVPEEARAGLDTVFANLGLPKKFLGRDLALHRELLSRADTVTVTYPEAAQSGPLVLEQGLVNVTKAQSLPRLAAASRLELSAGLMFTPERSSFDLGSATVERLRRYQDCAFRHWAEGSLPQEETEDWLKLLGALRERPRLNSARLDVLKSEFPAYAAWLSEHAETFFGLSFGEHLPQDSSGPRAYLDAAKRSGTSVSLYRFVELGRVASQAEAEAYIKRRWNEHWAAAYLLSNYQNRIREVWFFVWPVGGSPVAVYDGAMKNVWRQVATKQRRAARAFAAFKEGDVSPNPGFRCRECRVADICREGQR